MHWFSILTFLFTALYYSLPVVNNNKLNKIVNMFSKILGQQHSMTAVCGKERMGAL